MIHKVNQQQTGFTLVELMLAMAGVSVLLLAIAGVVLQIAGTYNKGVTMQAVNQAGRAIVTDMRRTIAGGNSFTVKPDPAVAASKSMFVEQKNTAGTVSAGRLCTGSYTYVWNLRADANAKVADMTNKYDAGSLANTIIRFVKVIDTGSTYCQPDSNGNYPAIDGADHPTELLSASNLAIQCVQVDKSCDGTTTVGDNTLYYISMLISNADQTTLTSAGDCQPPSNAASNQYFCAVNEFDFTAEAGTGGGQ